jgi:hypothetical protein
MSISESIWPSLSHQSRGRSTSVSGPAFSTVFPSAVADEGRCVLQTALGPRLHCRLHAYLHPILAPCQPQLAHDCHCHHCCQHSRVEKRARNWLPVDRRKGKTPTKVHRLCAGRLVAQCCRQAVWAADRWAAGGVWPQEEVGEHPLEGGRGHLHAQVRVQLTRGRLLKANTHVSAANLVEVEESKCRRPAKDFWTLWSSCLVWRTAKAGRLLAKNVVKK